ncbi:uncharacterized protein TM35_000014970 [Trypanosoma theileri]|uniref:Uncharacterized protein n=1 Tax=Trypanosoma theileri TaxID=67003 RepID=A0A1X0PAZ2_9TRYP|nr:uncharacterized protein TM35_000014970 [Trypanosoma theileri]ORC93620.1 hypothetical protein TM35_000014970 [Trypanosoma theileri]
MLLRRLTLSSRHLLPRVALWQGIRCSSEGTSETKPVSPVNIESFTLNEEVVKKDMEALQRWNDLSAVIDTSRANKQYEDILAAVKKGLDMLKEMGALNAPIQCETLLLLEAAQAHYNLQQFDDALKNAEEAKKSLLETPLSLRDAAQLAEVNQLIAYILLKNGKIEDSFNLFTEVLRWIDVDAKSAMPMQAVAAVNMRRSIVTGIGLCHEKLAEKEVASGGDGKEMYGKALDLLIEALNIHIDEGDVDSVKLTLARVLRCFEAVGDPAQAHATAEKYVRWCRRHNDEAGAAEGTAWLQELQEKYGVGNSAN